MRPLFAIGALVIALFSPCRVSAHDEVPIKYCDRLPVVEVTIDSKEKQLLLDTAATSILNLKSFAKGAAREIEVSSWTGTKSTTAHEIALNELRIGSTIVKNLRLPAVDLSAIGDACGGRIDGILGVDLLERLGAEVDLKNRVARLVPEESQEEVKELIRQLDECDAAFNRKDAEGFGRCLDKDVVMYTMGGDFHGRDAALRYLAEKYFIPGEPTKLDVNPRAQHKVGDVIWLEYDFSLTTSKGGVKARGTALCRHSEGRWRMVNMHHSVPEVIVQEAVVRSR